jgi:histidinol phosphatase-like enzyme
MNDLIRKKLVVFGKNGVLCPGVTDQRTGKSHAPNSLEFQNYFDGVDLKCAELIADGNTLCVMSNEGGVAFGIMSEDDAKLLTQAAAEYIGAKGWRVSCTHPKGKVAEFARESENRLPAPGMIVELMHEFGFLPQDTLVVGDWQFEKEAAANAGCKFMYAHQFFNRTSDPFADRLHAALDVK